MATKKTAQKKEDTIAELAETFVESDIKVTPTPTPLSEKLAEAAVVPELSEEEEAAAIKNRIQELKSNAIQNHDMEAVQGLLDQLPTEKTASERGTAIEEYAARVMSSQSADINVVPTMLGIAKTRKALKRQGYTLEAIESVIDKLEKAYEI